MIGGGRDRAELVEYDPDQYNESDDPNRTAGCHRGMYAGLNVHNPQAGWNYGWADDSPQSVMRARLAGYQIVHEDDPERAGYKGMIGHDHQDLDSSSAGFPGVVFMKRSAENERRVRAEEQDLRSKLLRGGNAENTYLNGAKAHEIESGGERFATKNHRTYATEGSNPDNPAVDSWSHRRQ